jgi:hypothetical protein
MAGATCTTGICRLRRHKYTARPIAPPISSSPPIDPPATTGTNGRREPGWRLSLIADHFSSDNICDVDNHVKNQSNKLTRLQLSDDVGTTTALQKQRHTDTSFIQRASYGYSQHDFEGGRLIEVQKGLGRELIPTAAPISAPLIFPLQTTQSTATSQAVLLQLLTVDSKAANESG